MAIFRQVHTLIWKDTWFLDLDPDEKLLFIYLFSNEASTLAGIYELSPRVMAFETGLTLDCISQAMQKFKDAGKIDFENGIVWVKRMRRYHETSSESVQTRIKKDIEKIPDCELKTRYLAHHPQPMPRVWAGSAQGVIMGDGNISPPYNTLHTGSAQGVGTVGTGPLNKAKKSKEKKSKEKQPTPQLKGSGGGLADSSEPINALYKLWAVNPDQAGNKLQAEITQLFNKYDDGKIMSLAYNYHKKGYTFTAALGAIRDQIPWEKGGIQNGGEGYY